MPISLPSWFGASALSRLAVGGFMGLSLFLNCFGVCDVRTISSFIHYRILLMGSKEGRMLQPHMTITTYSHHFKVSQMSHRGRDFCRYFAKGFLTYGLSKAGGRFVSTVDKVYAAADDARSYFRFAISALPEFLEELKQQHFQDEFIVRKTGPAFNPVKVNITIKPHFTPRDFQHQYIDYLSAEKPACKLVGLQTGKGKTFCALAAAANIGLRTVVLVKGGFLGKWMGDIQEITNTPKKRILQVNGTKGLAALFKNAKKKSFKYDFILISINTIKPWFDLYEKQLGVYKGFGFTNHPEDWINDIGAGCVITDEVHLMFHANYKINMYTHVPYSIALSATLLTKDKTMERLYEYMFPRVDRAPEMVIDRYIHSYALHFNFDPFTRVKTQQMGQSMYSHAALEESLMKNKNTLNRYLAMIDFSLGFTYFKNPKKDKKAAVFCATKEMCGAVTDYLKAKYRNLDIRRYISEDPYENAIEPDIRVTTIGSCGTGIDIPGLVSVILTQAIESIQANVQVLGRLRKIEGEKVEFVFFTADNLDKHVKYYADKKIMLKQRALTFSEQYYKGFI